MEDTRGTVNKCIMIARFGREREEGAEKKEIWGLTIAKCGCSTICPQDTTVFPGARL